jgi:hypothetical protein
MFIKQNPKFQLLSGLIAILAFGAGCRGFFVNPTLSTLAVGPATPTIQQGSTLQMAATGTYNDGSTKSLTGSAFWSTSDATIASVNTTGLVTGVSIGSGVTITAAVGTVSGSTTVTVQLGNITSIALVPATKSITQGSTLQYTATATTSDGKTQDITKSATWSSSNSSAGTISSSGFFTSATGLTADQPTTISAASDNVTGTATLTVTH